MKITNASGLPAPVYQALVRKELSRDTAGADISVTELIDSPRVRALRKKHKGDIEMEADSLLAAFLGTCFHKGVEDGTITGTAERRLSIEVRGWKLSGGMDHFHDGVLTDYKTAKTWKVSNAKKGRLEEFENQLNVYAHILRENGHAVSALKVFLLFNDWTSYGRARAKFVFEPNVRAGYPDKQWLYFEVPLWSPEDAAAYVDERVRLHQEAETKLPNCSFKEIWDGRRCEKYCSVNQFCKQYQLMLKTGVAHKRAEGE